MFIFWQKQVFFIMLIPQIARVHHQSWGSLSYGSSALECATLHLWAVNLEPFLVSYSCMAINGWTFHKQLVSNWVGSRGLCLIWGWDHIEQELMLFSISLMISHMSSWRCSNRLVWIQSSPVQGVLPYDWPSQISQFEGVVVFLNIVRGEVNSNPFALLFDGFRFCAVMGWGEVVWKFHCMLVRNILEVGDDNAILPI